MRKKVLSIMLALALTIGGAALPASTEVSGTAYASSLSTLESITPPIASKGSGTYYTFDGYSVSLSAEPNSIIFYSLNNTGYRLYSSPISITHDSTLKTYSYSFDKKGISQTATYTYNLIPYFFASLGDGEYDEVQRVYLKHATNGAKVYYTLDGTAPNENSTPYTDAGVIINKSCTLKAVVIKSGCTRNYITRNYIIKNPILDTEYIDGGLVTKNTDSSVSTDNKLYDYTSKWGYNCLNGTQKKAYEALFDAAKNHADNADISALKLKKNEIDMIYWAFDYDNPQFFALANGYSYSYYPSTGLVSSISLKYSRTAVQESNIKPSFNSITGKVLNEAKQQFNDYDKLKYIHDWIVNNTDYILNGPVYKSEADGPIVYGKALCEGYSKAFMYFAQSLGFDCICVVGEANGGAHMWNMVKLNGSWYHVDTTFDDPIMSDGSRVLRHDFFLKGTYEMNKTHKIDMQYSVPSAPRSY